MASFQSFEEMAVWQRARSLANRIYDLRFETFNGLNKPRYDFSFQDQIRRSALSIMANIAEGQGRRTDRDFANFLSTAHASASETRSHLYLALDRKYISQKEFDELKGQLNEIGRMLMGMMRHLRKPS
jgi:four helix bundle protein